MNGDKIRVRAIVHLMFCLFFALRLAKVVKKKKKC